MNKKQLWPDFALIFFLALLPGLFFWRLLTPNPADRMVIPTGDFTDQYFPLRAFTAQQWVRGQLPLWNPSLFGGQPALADIQSGALYPPHILQSLIFGWDNPLVGQAVGFPLEALQLQVIAHFSLAAVGMYLFARHIFLHLLSPLPPRSPAPLLQTRRARFAAVIASLVFTYSGYLTGFPVQQMTILEVSAWLPWVMWGLSAALERMANRRMTNERMTKRKPFSLSPPLVVPRSPAVFLGALAFAVAILAGHPQTGLYIFYLTLAYTLFYAWRSVANERIPLRAQVSEGRVANNKGRSSPPSGLRSASVVGAFMVYLVVWLIIVLLGAAIAAAQLLPTLEFITRSLRADLSYQAVSAGLPLNELVTILYPGFFGGSPAYVGIVTLVFIALALILPCSPFVKAEQKQSPPCSPAPLPFFWAGAALVSLLLAFGSHTFLYPLVYLLAPGFDSVRQQERIFLIYSFSAAMLAGYGAVALTGPLSKPYRFRYSRFERYLRWFALVGLLLTGFLIYGSALSTTRNDEVNLFYGVLWHHLLGLLMLGGMLVALALRPRRWLRRPWGMTLMAVWLALNLFTVNWRFNLASPPEPPPYTPNGVTQFLQNQPPPERVVSGGLLPGGHNAASVFNLPDLTGNTPLQLAAVDNFLRQMPAWRAWQLLNVRHIIDQRDIGDAGLSLVYAEGELKVFEMGDPFPPAWLVSQIEFIPEASQALARLAGDDFDLRQVAVVAEPLPLPLTRTVENATVETLNAQTFIVSTVEGPHLLVFSQIFYPGWQATLDGQAADLYPVNVILQGMMVPPGSHQVELTFNPVSFWTGGLISIVALLICLVGLVWGKEKENPKGFKNL